MRFPLSSLTNTKTSLPTASHPQLLNFLPSTTVVSMFSGLSMAPPDCPATKKKWFGYEGPPTEAVLSETQLAALSALEVHQAMTPGELAEHEKVQPPSMTRVIAVLEERSLVLRSPHPTDRRQVILTVTEEGRAVVQRVRRRKDAWLAQRLAELSTEERATLRAAVPILEKLSQSS